MRFSTTFAVVALAATPALSVSSYVRRDTSVQRSGDDSGAIALNALIQALDHPSLKQARTKSETLEKVTNNVNNIGGIVSAVSSIVDAIHSTYDSFKHPDQQQARALSGDILRTSSRFPVQGLGAVTKPGQLSREGLQRRLVVGLVARALEELD